jgi:hypothetical protein
MTGYFMKPQIHGRPSAGWAAFGPLQANWGTHRSHMPRGLRVHLTWPRTRSLYLG